MSSSNQKEAVSPKKLCILGSTGSIGKSTLEVVRRFPDEFKVVGLAANSNWKELEQQAEEFGCELIALSNTESAKNIHSKLNCLAGESAALRLVDDLDCDIVLGAITGIAGLESTLAAIAKGCRVALANKESLVCGGALIAAALEMNPESELLPVDSEHSALFQALQGESLDSVDKLILTASGGPFRGCKHGELSKVKAKDALKHPTWEMGAKITIDSATLINKALEFIEAYWLFGLSSDQIEVIVHPQSIIHSVIAFKDGSNIAQMSIPDMKGPIAYALRYPKIRKAPVVERLDFTKCSNLEFYELNEGLFPAIKMARSCLNAGGSASLILNSANEQAVEMFLKDQIGFLDIYRLINLALEKFEGVQVASLSEIMELDREVRKFCSV